VAYLGLMPQMSETQIADRREYSSYRKNRHALEIPRTAGACYTLHLRASTGHVVLSVAAGALGLTVVIVRGVPSAPYPKLDRLARAYTTPRQ
jgi:hypothetical protein